MDYRDVSPQEIVNSLFSDMKSKYEKVSSHEYLEWLKNIIYGWTFYSFVHIKNRRTFSI